MFSPFELDKEIIHIDDVKPYFINKAHQLYKIKNWHLTKKESNAIISCPNFTDKEIFEDYLKTSKNNIAKLSSIKINLLDLLVPLSKEITEETFLSIKNDFLALEKNLESIYEYHHLLKELMQLEKIDEIQFENKQSLYNLIQIIATFSPLKYLIEIARIKNQTKNTFFLFDLDATLFDNSPRVHKIIQDFIYAFSKEYPEETNKMKEIKRQDIVWGLKNILANFNISNKNEKFFSDIINFWYERFFSNSFIIDTPLKGAQDFLSELEKTGTKIVYLTGRFESMREGTSRNIKEYKFPLDKDGKNLVLKPSDKISDHDFKDMAMEEIKKFGYLVAGFDNEPINVNIFKNSFSYSNIFFLETNHSPNPPNILDNIHTIKNFVI